MKQGVRMHQQVVLIALVLALAFLFTSISPPNMGDEITGNPIIFQDKEISYYRLSGTEKAIIIYSNPPAEMSIAKTNKGNVVYVPLFIPKDATIIVEFIEVENQKRAIKIWPIPRK